MAIAVAMVAICAAPPAGHGQPKPNAPLDQTVLVYRILRGQAELGRQSMSFREIGGTTEVEIVTQVQVTAGGTQVYQFTQNSREVWRDRRLVGFSAQANDNGARHRIELAPSAGLSLLVADGSRSEVPPEIAPSSLWHPFMLKRPLLFDTLHGDVKAFEVRDEGEVTIQVGGRDMVTRHYVLKGQIRRKLWYARGNQLVRLALPARDGSEVVFELTR